MPSKQTKQRRPRRKKPRSGTVVNYEQPDWEPLLGLARIYVDEFMWMAEIELDNGTRLQIYKHYWTRRYLYLDGEGNGIYRSRTASTSQLVEDLVEHVNRVVVCRITPASTASKSSWPSTSPAPTPSSCSSKSR